MIPQALTGPVSTGNARDALVIEIGHVLAALVLVRVAGRLWPSVLAAIPVLLLVVVAVSFTGYVAAVLVAALSAADPPPFSVTRDRLKDGVIVLVVTVGYLLIPAAVLVTTAAVLQGSVSGPLIGIVPTIALLVFVAFGYTMPGGIATGLKRGVMAAFSRSAVTGLGNGAYFFAWTAALVCVVFGWTILTAAAPRTIAALFGAAIFPYTHLVATQLIGEGLRRSGWD